jgi:selenocysteine lyase/cysteine desulfurase
MLLYGMREALRILVDADPTRIAPYIFGLLDSLVTQLSGIDGFKVLSCLDKNSRSGILSIETPEGPEVVERLVKNGIQVSYREGGLRVSPHLYNTEDDIEKLVASLLQRE